MREKKCFKCKKNKPLRDYYKHSRMADGHLNKCKECTKTDSIKTRKKRLEYYKEYDRKRSWLPHRIKKRKEIAERWKSIPKLKKRMSELKRKWIKKNAIKKAAYIITSNAIRDGRLIRKPCEVCNKKKVEAHHDNYYEPLNVRWMCQKHHVEHHKMEREKSRTEYL